MPHLHYLPTIVGLKTSRNVHAHHVCEVEHVTFTPLVMSAFGSFTHGASIIYKRLASLLFVLQLWVG